jgi:undecaprenyl-diphosphatase
VTIATFVKRAPGGHPPRTRLAPWFVRFVGHRPSARTIATACFLSFAGLAVVALVAEGLLLAVDRGVEESVLGVRSRPLDTTMVALTFLGTRWVIGTITLGLVVWSVYTGKARPLTFVIVAAVLLNPLLEFGFKEVVQRVRPDTAQLVTGRGPSFPSGHVLASTGFYGMVPLLVWETARSRTAQLGALIGSLAVILIIAASRVYLDVHWTTDVVAGMLLGTALVVAGGHFYLTWRETARTSPIYPIADRSIDPSKRAGGPTVYGSESVVPSVVPDAAAISEICSMYCRVALDTDPSSAQVSEGIRGRGSPLASHQLLGPG